MIKSKRQMFIIIGVFTLVMMLGTVTYAFFNYTRTGSANTIKTGKISFNTNQTSTLTLTNVFPVSSSNVGNDYTQDTLKVTITGDTTYEDGIEYLITAEDVNVVTNTGKSVPLSFNIGVTGNLGTEDTENDQVDYFADRGSTTSYYKVLDNTVKYDGQFLVVGYIAKGATGINGTINIKAYLDDDKIAISDTYDGTESETNGTTRDWVDDRIVITTSEWNGFAETGHELSFKVKIEANEGVWVDDVASINAAIKLPTSTMSGVTEVHFVRLTANKMQSEYDKATVKADLTDNSEGKVLGWQDGTKYYVASTGETYLPENSAGYFGSGALTDLTKIEFNNINTSRVKNMSGMFTSCHNLTSIDISSFDMSEVTNTAAMFYYDSSLTKISLHNKGGANLANSINMFGNCSNLKYIDMRGFNFGTSSLASYFGQGTMTHVKYIDLSGANTSGVTNMYMMFAYIFDLEAVDLSGIDVSHVTNMSSMFAGNSNLKTIYVSNTWNPASVTSSTNMFSSCNSIRGGAGTTYDEHNLNATYARIDGGPNSQTPGYLTLKTN